MPKTPVRFSRALSKWENLVNWSPGKVVHRMAEFQTPFGEVVRRLRLERGIAPEDFGDIVGLDWRILAGMERGEYQIYLETIEQG